MSRIYEDVEIEEVYDESKYVRQEKDKAIMNRRVTSDDDED